MALGAHALARGFRVSFSEGRIHITRGDREMILSNDQFIQVPIMEECFELFFRTIRATAKDRRQLLDFSAPGVHQYIRSGASFHFPSAPEDDVMDAYTSSYLPKAGDVVWDAGAHAGATSYFFAEMVGPSGLVYAFEPDDRNYEYLIRNIELHGLTNVIPIRKAIAGATGHATFNMDGTMAAGINDFLAYPNTGRLVEVETITIAEACEESGRTPAYIKMDIEGAEVAAVEGSAEFLKANAIHFAIESYHRINDRYTYILLEEIFPKLGYAVKSSASYGQMFTWAERTPPPNRRA
jgi:FkbM family methyltransferase